MKKQIVLIVIAVVAFSNAFGQRDDFSKKEAERIWELAIKAKGGREKLISIKNMVSHSHAKVYFAPLTYENKIVSLGVFPDKVWTWDDNRPSVFGLRMSMYNYATGMKYYKVLGSPDNVDKLVPFEPNEQKQIGSKLPSLVFDLMETYWLKPIPENVRSGKIRGMKVDIVRTALDGERYDFSLDKNTHLPLQISHFYYLPSIKKEIAHTVNLSDYIEIDGIMMASVSFPEGESGKERTAYQFNVEYDESIFKTPASFEMGSEAWKVKRK
jgi:hypothetical protein